MMSERFKQDGLTAALAFPFRVATLDPLLYIETLAPDIRFAALSVASLVLAGAAALGRAPARSPSRPSTGGSSPSSRPRRPLGS